MIITVKKYIYLFLITNSLLATESYFPCTYSWHEITIKDDDRKIENFIFNQYTVPKKTGLIFIGQKASLSKSQKSNQCKQHIKKIFEEMIQGKRFKIIKAKYRLGEFDGEYLYPLMPYQIPQNIKNQLWKTAKQKGMSIKCGGSNLKCKAYTTKELNDLGFTEDKYPRID